MGQIQRSKHKTTVRFTVDEVLMARVAASKDVTFTFAEMISKYARIKPRKEG